MTEAIGGFVLIVLAGVIGGLLYTPLARWSGRRAAQASKIHCGIRVVSGRLPGFSNAWRHGSATFSRGVVQFEGHAIRVTELDSDARQPTADEMWWTSFDTRVVIAKVETAVLELAVRTPQLEVVRRRLMSEPEVSS